MGDAGYASDLALAWIAWWLWRSRQTLQSWLNWSYCFFTDCNYIGCLLTVVFMILSAFIMLNVIKACTWSGSKAKLWRWCLKLLIWKSTVAGFQSLIPTQSWTWETYKYNESRYYCMYMTLSRTTHKQSVCDAIRRLMLQPRILLFFSLLPS